MKKTPQSISSLNQNEGAAPVVTILGNERARFPGIGRRKNSYDRSLRLFYKKTAPSRFRRVQTYRFNLLRPSMLTNFYTRGPSTASSFLTRRNKRFSRQFAKSTYLNRS